MRALLLLVEVAAVVAVGYVVYAAVLRPPRGRQVGLPPGGRWRPRHYADDSHTVVTVARMTPAGEVFEEHVVARISDSDGDWSRKFLQAKQEAEERAFHLNADG